MLWQRVLSEQRLLVTTDKGFVQHRKELHHGLLVIRLRQPNEGRIHTRVIEAVQQFREKDWPGMIVVMRDIVQSVTRRQ